MRVLLSWHAAYFPCLFINFLIPVVERKHRQGRDFCRFCGLSGHPEQGLPHSSRLISVCGLNEGRLVMAISLV